LSPNLNNDYAIRWAARNGHTEVVKVLLADDRVSPEVARNYAIGMAAINGHVEVVKLLMQHPKVNPADDEEYALIHAERHNHYDVIHELVKDKRVNPFIYNGSIFNSLIYKGRADTLELILQIHPEKELNQVSTGYYIRQFLNCYSKTDAKNSSIYKVFANDPRTKKIIENWEASVL
jgi:hypothetical protein